jgi:hypothetical protein
MITRMLVLAMVLAITLAVTTPALAGTDFATAKPIPGFPDYEITDKGNLIYGRDVIVGKCGSTQDFAFNSKSLDKEATRACEKAGYSVKSSPTQDRVEPQTPLTKTGGLPVILVPVTLLVACGFLICKSAAR